jgi:hypothetical protein
VSPIAVKLRSWSLPMLPTSAGPVLMPTRKRGQPGRPAATRPIAPCMARAARAASNACSGCRVGALKIAITASPTNCTTVPPASRITGTAAPKYVFSIRTTSSGADRSENGVKPRKSAISTVTS